MSAPRGGLPLLTRLVAAKRAKAKLSLRDAADQAGIAFNSMTRVEHGCAPDVHNFLKLCTWLGISPAEFVTLPEETPRSTVGLVGMILAADNRLSIPDAVQIGEVVEVLYAAKASIDVH